MDQFYSICLQGDIPAALKYLRSIEPKSKEIIELEQQYTARFITQNEELTIDTDDQWIKSIISAYHQYFRKVLTKIETLEQAEQSLYTDLQACLPGKNPADMTEVENALADIFAEKGYFFLGGVTAPFRGPYIWRKTEATTFTVEIPHTIQDLTVYMMSDFILDSWIGYATFHKKTVGGWAKEDGIYCNSKSYDNIDDDQFQISYLKHEAQHVYDYEHFPELSSAELEYRAKLVELIYSKEHSLLEKFLNEAKDDPKFPHSYAAYQIKKNLTLSLFDGEFELDRQAWLDRDYQEIALAASELFQRNTRELVQKYDTGGESRI